jgi:hypothetical protein
MMAGSVEAVDDRACPEGETDANSSAGTRAGGTPRLG